LNSIVGNDRRDELVDEIDSGDDSASNRKYLDKIIELQNQVEQLQRQKDIMEREGREYISSSDAEARLMKSRDGKIPAYNIQIAVDADNKMIADSEVVTEETDLSQLPKMIESIKEELGEVPEEVLADRGYNNPDLIEAVEKKEEGSRYIRLRKRQAEIKKKSNLSMIQRKMNIYVRKEKG